MIILGRRITPLSFAAACLAAAAIIGLFIHARTGSRFRVLVFDNSASFQPDGEKLRRFVDTYTSDLGRRDRWCLWVFGKEPVLVVGPRSGGERPGPLPSIPVVDTASSISRALRAAAETAGNPNEIVILTDGRETTAAARSGGVDVEVPVYPVVTDSAPPRDARVYAASAPQKVAPGERFAVEAEIRASVPGDVVVKILRDGVELDSRIVTVERDGYGLSLEDSLDSKGLHVYTIAVEMTGDVFPENDSWRIPVRAGKSKPVLVVSPFGEKSAFFRMLERAPGLSPRACTPRAFAQHPFPAAYHALIMEGVRAAEIRPRDAGVVKSWVLGGGGLLIAPTSRARNGSDIAGTDLGELLPVDFGVGSGKRHLILAVDRSGSMAQRAGTSVKIEMARNAVLSAAAFMGGSGRFDVLSFNTEVSKTYSGVEGVDLDALGRELAALKAAGGTDILPVLDTARGMFAEGNADMRMLIVISDGFAAKRDWSEEVNFLKAAEVAVSTVGIGDEVNVDLLSRLASETGGRWIHLHDASEIPSVVAEEARSAMSGNFVVGKFGTAIVSNHPAAGGVSSPPGVAGYTLCRARKDAVVVISTEEDNPLLTVWRISSGKSAFLSVPFVREYIGEWLRWKDLQALVEGMVRWCAREDSSWEVPMPYPQEFRNVGTDRSALAQMASVTGGKILKMGELPEGAPTRRTKRSLSPLLAWLAIACLFADVALPWMKR